MGLKYVVIQCRLVKMWIAVEYPPLIPLLQRGTITFTFVHSPGLTKIRLSMSPFSKGVAEGRGIFQNKTSHCL